MKNEKDVKAAVKKILGEFNAYWFMPVQTGYGRQGIPDFVVCLNGFFIGVETKYGGNKLSPHQEIQRAAILKASGDYYVVDENNLAEFAKSLRMYKCA